jgi:ATP-dependent protease HslVU (ClpYQ) peptidase subunit
MTIIAGVRHKNHLILAADGQATSSKDYIENNKCVKIEEHGDFILAGAGSCSSTAIMKRVLNSVSPLAYDVLDLAISAESTGIKEGDEDSEGSFLLLRRDIQGLITDFLYVEIGHIISVQNLLLENQDIVAIGCGAPLFRASFASFEANSLKETKLNIMTAMKVTAELSPYCNDIIDMRTYKVVV